MLVIPVLGRKGWANPWGMTTMQPSLLGKPHTSGNKVNIPSGTNNSKGGPLTSAFTQAPSHKYASIHMFVYIHVPTNMCIHVHEYTYAFTYVCVLAHSEWGDSYFQSI